MSEEIPAWKGPSGKKTGGDKTQRGKFGGVKTDRKRPVTVFTFEPYSSNAPTQRLYGFQRPVIMLNFKHYV